MQSLSKQSSAIFAKLVDGLNDIGDSKKIDNSNGAFMAVHVEIIGRAASEQSGFIVSIAHYFESNGDLVCDPDMTFLHFIDGEIFPMTFEQGGMLYQEAARFEDGKFRYDSVKQKDITKFADSWLSNIKEQQGL